MGACERALPADRRCTFRKHATLTAMGKALETGAAMQMKSSAGAVPGTSYYDRTSRTRFFKPAPPLEPDIRRASQWPGVVSWADH